MRFVLDFLEAVASGPVSLVGLSLGVALAAPERGHKLALVDSYGLRWDGLRPGRLHIMEGGGHWPQREQPAEFSRVVGDFLRD